jgi:hypothetical protein
MSAHTFTPGRHWSFTHYSQAWYFEASNFDDDLVDAVNIHTGGADYGPGYEVTIQWRNIGNEVAPQVRAFDDSWLAFAELADVFAWLATQHDKSPAPEDVCAALLAMGFEDRTERERP